MHLKMGWGGVGWGKKWHSSAASHFFPAKRLILLLASFTRDLTPAPCWLLAATAAL